MFNKPSWNNKREGFLRPPDEEQEERKKNLLERMRETIASKKQEAEEKKPTLEEISKQDHFDIDASIAKEANKTIKMTQPKLKGKATSVVVELPVKKEKPEEIINAEPTEYIPPDPANPSVDDFMEALTIILRYLDTAKAEITTLQDNVHTADLETSDILHSVELTQFTEEEKADMTDKLKEVRIRRRTCKKRLEYFTEIGAYLDTNKTAVNALKQLKGKLKKVEEKQKNASFHFRVRTDLKTSCNDKIYAV